jgi:hypothetical protein
MIRPKSVITELIAGKRSLGLMIFKQTQIQLPFRRHGLCVALKVRCNLFTPITGERSRPSAQLDHKLLGPFKISDKISDSAYRLDLPPAIGISNTFHVSRFEPHKKGHPNQPQKDAPPIFLESASRASRGVFWMEVILLLDALIICNAVDALLFGSYIVLTALMLDTHHTLKDSDGAELEHQR